MICIDLPYDISWLIDRLTELVQHRLDSFGMFLLGLSDQCGTVVTVDIAPHITQSIHHDRLLWFKTPRDPIHGVRSDRNFQGLHRETPTTSWSCRLTITTPRVPLRFANATSQLPTSLATSSEMRTDASNPPWERAVGRYGIIIVEGSRVVRQRYARQA